MGTTIDPTAAARRLLVRTGFAATSGQVAAAARDDLAHTVDRVLAGAAMPDAGAQSTPPPPFPALSRPAKGKAGTDAKEAYAKELRNQVRAMTLWWLDRMVAADRPWVERRTLLWHGHFATAVKKVRWPAAMIEQNETERRLGGGNFDTFARAMVVDPALMIWLDATGNTAAAPNENLARELMELFTLGHGNYSEADVRQAARALTGWNLGPHKRGEQSGPPTAVFSPARHAPGPQTILRTTKDFDANTLVDLLVSQPASPRYVASRLWGWLVSTRPPTAASLDRIVAAYGGSNDLGAMFRAMLTDRTFTDSDSVLVKQPIEYVVGALRSLGVRPSRLEPKAQQALLAGLNGLGQIPFQPPNVGGWPTGTAWLTTAAAETRVKLAAGLARVADISAVASARLADRPEAAADVLGLGDWTARTRRVLADVADNPAEVVTLALISPEYTVSG